MKFTAKTFIFLAIFYLIVTVVVAQTPPSVPTDPPATAVLTDKLSPTEGAPSGSVLSGSPSTSPSPSPSPSSSSKHEVLKPLLIGLGTGIGVILLIGIPYAIFILRKRGNIDLKGQFSAVYEAVSKDTFTPLAHRTVIGGTNATGKDYGLRMPRERITDYECHGDNGCSDAGSPTLPTKITNIPTSPLPIGSPPSGSSPSVTYPTTTGKPSSRISVAVLIFIAISITIFIFHKKRDNVDFLEIAGSRDSREKSR
ncbi:hypothetical protein Glove_421g72 [Diversispora epigaea]|uniref:Mid2 domain-containing protein n=1 Tax=Diversispora epigaea TaxID=1348612 RepID=A0A397GXG1_9GLOM|nr:hypothetical protein Glove_421g72 [Diversispora epigaea]